MGGLKPRNDFFHEPCVVGEEKDDLNFSFWKTRNLELDLKKITLVKYLNFGQYKIHKLVTYDSVHVL